jgi:hypothetical protein
MKSVFETPIYANHIPCHKLVYQTTGKGFPLPGSGAERCNGVKESGLSISHS